ncbi:MAG: serine/threonine protein kinase [Pseudomonadota bacterium]
MREARPDVKFVATTVLKRDVLSETFSGHAEDEMDRKLVLRRLSGLPLWSRGLARVLARREVRGLRAVQGIDGVPELVRVDREGILRAWSEGTPLNIARPSDPRWYRDASRLLRDLRARGVTHNDLAKPQNWLMRPDGGAGVIDFQLTRVHRRRGRLFRVMAYEDLRHLLKQRKRYCPETMGPTAKRILSERSGPSRLWRRTFKRAYLFISRKLFGWSDGEGTAHAVLTEAPGLRRALCETPGIKDVAISAVPMPGRTVGLYAFVETQMSRHDVGRLAPAGKLAFVQTIDALPRQDDQPRMDILELIAMNRLDELEILLAREPDLRTLVAPIRDARLNFSDRVLRGRERG